MKVNLAQLNNNELVAYVNDQIAQYEAQKEQSKLTSYQIYNGVPISDFQIFDKQLQRCLMFGTEGANETAIKVKSILRDDAGINDRPQNAITSMYDYYKKTNQVHKFFENGKR